MSTHEDRPVIEGPVLLPGHLEALLDKAPIERALVLRERLNIELHVLYEKLEHLYGDEDSFSEWFKHLVVQTVEIALTRSDDLWSLDRQREAKPNWHLNGSLGYCAYVDKFAGSLAGVHQRIAHLKELGVTYLHLLPFLKPGSPPNDGGFAVASYDEVNPALGSNQDLLQLTHALRSSGISLCSDFVLNHVSHEHKWAVQARTGDKRYRAYFHWAHSADEVAAYEKNLIQIFPNTAPGNFTFIPEVKAWAWTTFYPYQWDLNYTQPDVFAEMSQSLLRLANLGIEAFRLDSTGFLWKRAGTNCMNQPEVHWILQALRSLINIAAPGVLLKAEAIMPTQDLPPYFGMGQQKGQECHVAYHSSLMSASWLALSEEDAQIIRDVLMDTPALPEGCTWMTYVRCHDDIGWNVLRPELAARGEDQYARLINASQFFAGQVRSSYAQGAAFQAHDPSVVHGTNGMASALVGITSAQTTAELKTAQARLVMMQALSLFVGGLPLIYMGDEWAQGNTPIEEIAKRCGTDGRELHRPVLDEASFAKRHNTHCVEGQIFSALRSFIDARKNFQILNPTQPLTVCDTGISAVLALRRGEHALGLFNFSSVIADLSATHWTRPPAACDLISGESVDLNKLKLHPYSALWLSV